MMKAMSFRIIFSFAAIFVLLFFSAPAAHAEETEDNAVSAVIAQLEEIDSLQEMQDNRSVYDSAIEYDVYVAKMFSARLAAERAYNALSDEQKVLIDADLVKKLEDELSTSFYKPTVSVKVREDEYAYEVIFKNRIVYEIGHHVSTEMPCTIVLVDTRESGGSWTPDGLYEYGESNYEVTYCCDSVAPVVGGTHYKRINLEDSGYYSEYSAMHIRAIVQNSYPYISIEQMKANMKANGVSAEFIDSLTRGDIISAVQMAIWTYSNTDHDGVTAYTGTIEMTDNSVFRNPLHDYTNELWSWWDTKNSYGIFDEEAAYRVNNLVYYLCSLPGVKAEEDQIVISDVKITRAAHSRSIQEAYTIGMYVHINHGGGKEDDLTITVTSSSADENGERTITSVTTQEVTEETVYYLTVEAKPSDTVEVVVEGTQELAKGVYFYEPLGGRNASQCLVGMAGGETNVRAAMSFDFKKDIERGLRIYKTDGTQGLPISEITFNIYKVVPDEGEVLNPVPTNREIERFMTAENLVDSVTTDLTGYASIGLDEGMYLVEEVHNPEKVQEPVAPFYISVPTTDIVVDSNGHVTTHILNVVSVYPKNTPIEDSDNPPDLPTPPDNVTGSFSILKVDANDSDTLLEGARFRVYRAATKDDQDAVTVTCEGVDYAVVPVEIDGKALILTTDGNGTAVSPELTCGVYFIVETRPPAGYMGSKEAIAVAVHPGQQKPAIQTVTVTNEKGILLPETGGIGTAWFYIGGAVLVVAATVLLISKRRMRNSDL